jgi:hypothetical protein
MLRGHDGARANAIPSLFEVDACSVVVAHAFEPPISSFCLRHINIHTPAGNLDPNTLEHVACTAERGPEYSPQRCASSNNTDLSRATRAAADECMRNRTLYE